MKDTKIKVVISWSKLYFAIFFFWTATFDAYLFFLFFFKWLDFEGKNVKINLEDY